MPTAMHWYNMVAAKFGVDPTDGRAVEDFFVKKFRDLGKHEQGEIMRFLLGHDGSPKIPDDCACSSCVKMHEIRRIAAV